MPSSALPITRTWRSIRNGFSGARTARCSSPRTPRRNTRTSFRSTSRRASWRELWEELKSVVLFWMDKGVRIFRVDNPHTKPFPFWEWLIGEIKKQCPEAIFLAEAFTRPKVMYRLAKLGFSQSYTYFTWRNTKSRAHHVSDGTDPQRGARILPPQLLAQHPGHPARVSPVRGKARLSDPAGPGGNAFLQLRHLRPALRAVHQRWAADKEEYLDAEKYEIRRWDWEAPGNIKDLITAREPHPPREQRSAVDRQRLLL